MKKILKHSMICLMFSCTIFLMGCGVKVENLNKVEDVEIINEQKLSPIDDKLTKDIEYTNLDESMIDIKDDKDGILIINKTEYKLTNIEGDITFLNNEDVCIGKTKIEIPVIKEEEKYLFDLKSIEIPEKFDKCLYNIKAILKEPDLF